VFSASVEFMFPPSGDRWKVYRCNSPRTVKLYLNGKLKLRGDEAEEKIYQLIGVTYKQYVWGMFLKGDSSLLEVSPQEKYDGICALAGVQVKTIEEKMTEIKDHKKSLDLKSSDLNLKIGKSQGILSSLNKDLKNMEKDLPDDLCSETTKMEDLKELKKILKKLICRIKETEETLSNFGDSARSLLEKEIASLESKLTSIEEQLLETEGYTEEYLEAAKAANEVRKARLRLEEVTEAVQIENQAKKKKILEYFAKNLPSGTEPEQYRDYVRALRERWGVYKSEYSAIEKMKEELSKNKLALSKIFQAIRKAFPSHPDLEEVKSPKAMLAALKEIRKEVSPVGKCPSCQAKLIYLDQEFVGCDSSRTQTKYDPGTLQTLQALSNFESSVRDTASKISIQIPEPPTKPKKPLEKAEEILTNIEVMQGQLRSLDAGRSPLITKARTILETLESDPHAGLVDPNDINDEELATYYNLSKTHARLIKIQKDTKAVLKEKRNKLKIGESIESLLEELGNLKNEKKGIEERIKAWEEANQRSRMLESYSKLKNAIAKEKEVLEVLEIAKKEASEMSIGLSQLKTKIKEAMLKSIEETVRSINGYADEYVKRLLVDGTYISLGLSSSVEGKVVVKVYRPSSPEETAKYEDLSDGERQRARLAFFLGINDFLDARLRMVIIDEALNQVEESLNIRSLDLLAERPGTKIIISHEALGGKFDHQVDFISS